ncbi:MAG: hypothetical protein K0V04_10290 [Deltaproteobacteria bacterium]|nr:hypothetical protein [Deltaproteobacteria bacterium]
MASRLGAGLFGLALLLATVVAGLFTAIPIMRWFGPPQANDLGWTALVFLGLFGPMTVILASAAWSMFNFVATGHRGSFVNRGALLVLLIVLGALMLMITVVGIIRPDLPMIVGGVSSMGLLSLMRTFLRSPPPAS